MRHEARRGSSADYDVNNAYQYIISREETHVSWLQHALLDLGAAIPADPARPRREPRAAGNDAVLRARRARTRASNQQFVDAWRPRVERVTNARHKGMLKVVLGEMLEHQRLFDQAAEGRDGHHRRRIFDQRARAASSPTGAGWNSIRRACRDPRPSPSPSAATSAIAPRNRLCRRALCAASSDELRVSSCIETEPVGVRRPADVSQRRA